MNHLAKAGGSKVPSFNGLLFKVVLAMVQPQGADPDEIGRCTAAVYAALAGCKPVDEIEGMIAGQMVAMHLAAMTCFQRANLPNQPADIASKQLRDGANLGRAMVDMVDALARHRGKGPQIVRVERVTVHEGGRAIVGTVQAGAPVARAISQEAPGLMMDDIAGPLPELVSVDRSREGGGG